MATETQTIRLFGKQIRVEPTRTRSGIELPTTAFKVADKKLTESDVLPTQGRLMIPGYQDLYTRLSDPEKTSLGTSKQGIRLTAMDNDSQEYQLSLSKWSSMEKLVLNKGWKNMVEANGLQVDDKIELWGYRLDGELRLVVDVYERHNQ